MRPKNLVFVLKALKCKLVSYMSDYKGKQGGELSRILVREEELETEIFLVRNPLGREKKRLKMAAASCLNRRGCGGILRIQFLNVKMGGKMEGQDLILNLKVSPHSYKFKIDRTPIPSLTCIQVHTHTHTHIYTSNNKILGSRSLNPIH